MDRKSLMTADSSGKHEACNLVLFGTLGDLATRKLLPSLYYLEKANLLHPETRIIGVAREDLTQDEYTMLVREKMAGFVQEPIEAGVWSRLKERLSYLHFNFQDLPAYDKLNNISHSKTKRMIAYYAVPPSLYGQLSEGLAQAGLINESSRVVLEKPIGHDFRSSQTINDQVARFFNEQQIYRIDHYLGKETVLNLLVLRCANPFLSSIWNNQSIDYVQITVAEEIGVEGRWEYYNDAGQLRDMLQNHLLQVLSLVAMEPPIRLDADRIRDEKLNVLKALRPIDRSLAHRVTVRGQYQEGNVHNQPVLSYVQEEGAQPASQTETFVAVRVDIDNSRWAGVPFYLRTGKRMPKKISEVVIFFKPQAHDIFRQAHLFTSPNKLIIRLQPDEGMEIQIMNKVPGLGEFMELQESTLNLSFDKTFKLQHIPDAYERLLLQVMLGNQSLFVRRDEIEQAWLWVDGVVDAWRNNAIPLCFYEAGSWGPLAADKLLSQDGRSWES